jgi:hypothetical protein
MQQVPRKESSRYVCIAGLPDGIFSDKKSQIGNFLGMEDVGIYNGHLIYWMVIWYENMKITQNLYTTQFCIAPKL